MPKCLALATAILAFVASPTCAAAVASPVTQSATDARPSSLSLFSTAGSAQMHCSDDKVVWIDAVGAIYYYKEEQWYGRTHHGAYACEKEAIKAGDRARQMSCSEPAAIISAFPKDHGPWDDKRIILNDSAWFQITSPYVNDPNSTFLAKLRPTDQISICFGPDQTWSDGRLCGSLASIVYDQQSNAYMNAFAYPSGRGSPPSTCKPQTSLELDSRLSYDEIEPRVFTTRASQGRALGRGSPSRAS